MSENALQHQLHKMSDTEKHVALSAIITVAAETGGFFITEERLSAVFTETQYRVNEALKNLN